jgi:hypothetical protein
MRPQDYRGGVKRLELERVRLCKKCGRGGAELRTDDGETIVVPLDPVRARELRSDAPPDGVDLLIDCLLASLERDGTSPQEIVLDLSDGKLRGLLSCTRGDEPEVIACTAEEGVALAIRGGLKLYATDEALAQASARTQKPDHRGGAGGPDTLH